ncbi:MAG: WD40 repeat domain-containing protein, partial [Persicimonas sp.]
HTLSESIDMQPEPSAGTSQDSELNRTVQSEASVAQADAEAARARKEQEASRETSGFFRSSEWDTTGPKAAILRRRTPSQSVDAIGRVDESADAAGDAEARQDRARPGFATSEKRLRGSGLYAVPELAADLDGGHRCASGPGGRLAVADAANRVHIGLPGRADPVVIDLQGSPPMSCLALTEYELFTGHSDGTLWQWSLQERTGQIIHQNASASPVVGVDCDGKSRWLIAGTEAGGVYLAEAGGDGSFQPLRIHSGKAVRAVALTDQQNVFAVARADGTIGIFDVSSPTTLVHRLTAESRVDSMAFSNDGYILAVVFAQKRLALYHVLNGGLLMRNDAMIEQPLSVSFDENDQLVGYCEIDRRIFGWDLHHNLVAHQRSSQ